MTSTHEACRERMVAARAVASIMTMSDGRLAADAGCGTELVAAVTTAPAATPRTERRSNSGWFDSESADAMNSSRYFNRALVERQHIQSGRSFRNGSKGEMLAASRCFSALAPTTDIAQ